MKDLYIVALHLSHGGVEKAITNMANMFADKYTVHILCTYDMPQAPVYELDQRVQVQYLLKDIPNRQVVKQALQEKHLFTFLKEGLKSVKILYLKKHVLKKTFRNIKEGIVITTRNEDSILLSKYGNKNVFKIAQLHHDHNFEKKLVNDFKTKYNNIDFFVLLCKQLCDEVKEIMQDNRHTKCISIPNFLDHIPAYIENERDKTCISVGRIHPVKGFDRAIRIFAGVHERCPQWKYQLIGDGDEAEIANLQSLIHELHLEQVVTLCGVKSSAEIEVMMKQASLYIMTSHSEGLPFVLLEAQSCALPIIAFDVRVGPGAIVKDEAAGYLIKDQDEDAFVKKLVTLLEDSNLRKKMSMQAYEDVQTYSYASVKQQWMDVLTKGEFYED